MKKYILISFLSFSLSLASYSQTKPKTVALLLGSATLSTLANRVNVLTDLYRIKKIDKIIVSGGCGAHSSGICEASEMKLRLIAKGIPQDIIYKEENSKTTVQNYIFSRVLRDEFGEQIIQKNDSVFVVSDHWHAIAVAARFNKYDQVHAKFFIEGDLTPTPTALLDYGGIFNKIADNSEFILKGTWATPSAVYNTDGNLNYVFLDRIYSLKNADTSQVLVKKIFDLFPSLPHGWETIDAVANDKKNNTLILFYKQTCQIISRTNKPVNVSLAQLISGLPANVTYVDASFIKENELYLFAGDKVIVAKRTGKTFRVSSTENIKEIMHNWPYAWGSGNISAANYNPEEKKIYLYKNGQYVKVDYQSKTSTEPQKLQIGWKETD